MLQRTRRAAAAGIVAVTGLALGLGALVPAQAAEPNPYALSGARWLSEQLTDGVVHNPNWGGFDDYGLTLDVFFALDGVGARPKAAAKALETVIDNQDLYTRYTAYPYDPDDDGPLTACPAEASEVLSAAQVAKLATAVQVAEADPTDVDGVDLIADLASTISASGRSSDVLDPADACYDYSNAIGQGYAVSALQVAGHAKAADALSYLLLQQCANGAFRQIEADTQCVTGGDVDTTALVALQLLRAKTDGGLAGVDAAINKAAMYLVGAQRADGSFGGSIAASNANSTGIAAGALLALGKPGTAANAAAWLLGLQVRDDAAENTKLAKELGAIAFTKAALKAGYGNGVTDATQDEWRRATTQAVLGINALAPAKKLTLNAPNGKLKAGKKVKVTGTGLLAGERWTLYLKGKKVASGVANAKGGFTAQMKVPKAKKVVTTAAVKVTGSRVNRAGADTIKIAKKAPAKAGAKKAKNKK